MVYNSAILKLRKWNYFSKCILNVDCPIYGLYFMLSSRPVVSRLNIISGGTCPNFENCFFLILIFKRRNFVKYWYQVMIYS